MTRLIKLLLFCLFLLGCLFLFSRVTGIVHHRRLETNRLSVSHSLYFNEEMSSSRFLAQSLLFAIKPFCIVEVYFWYMNEGVAIASWGFVDCYNSENNFGR